MNIWEGILKFLVSREAFIRQVKGLGFYWVKGTLLRSSKASKGYTMLVIFFCPVAVILVSGIHDN